MFLSNALFRAARAEKSVSVDSMFKTCPDSSSACLDQASTLEYDDAMGSGGVSVLKKSVCNLAVKALKSLRKQRGLRGHDAVPDDVCEAAQIKVRPGRVAWGMLEKRLSRGHRPGSGLASAIGLASFLLGKSAADLCITFNPAHAGRRKVRSSAGKGKERHVHPASVPRMSTTRMAIKLPKTIFEHRVVMVAHLPEGPDGAELHAVAFVAPNDGTGLWYVQSSRLRAGRAVSWYLHLGNPLNIGHIQSASLPVSATVHVFCTVERWPDLEDALSSESVAQLLAERHLVDSAHPKIVRTPAGVNDIEIVAANSRWRAPQPEVRPCQAPVTISWSGSGGAHLEIRRALGDVFCYGGLAVPGVTIRLGKPNPKAQAATQIIWLEKPDLYRVKLYPGGRRTFVDPVHEWWLDIHSRTDQTAMESGPVKARLPTDDTG